MGRSSSGIAIVLLIFALAVIFVIPYLGKQNSSNVHGHITTLGVALFSDEYALHTYNDLDWGIMDPGGESSKVVYIKNSGNVPISLSYQISNWQPSNAETYLALSWDYSGTILQPDAMQRVVLVLKVSSAISGITDFAFDITFTGTGGA